MLHLLLQVKCDRLSLSPLFLNIFIQKLSLKILHGSSSEFQWRMVSHVAVSYALHHQKLQVKYVICAGVNVCYMARVLFGCVLT